jgi:hypothetical protein
MFAKQNILVRSFEQCYRGKAMPSSVFIVELYTLQAIIETLLLSTCKVPNTSVGF